MISSSSSLTLIPEEGEKGKMNPTTSKSCESLYSNSSKGSAGIIYRPIAHTNVNNKLVGIRGTRQPAIIPATNEVRQRVLSARRLRMKTLQNQLTDAQQTITELAHENRILRTLHKRQDSALSKYESNNAELPQLLHSHAEELRMWQTKHRNLQAVNKELEQKLKQKEAVILTLSDQNKYFVQLNKDKNLEDRQRLTEKLQMLELRLQEKDNDMKMISRKMQLDIKQAKQQMQVEQKRNREILMKLEKVRLELSGYRKLEEMQLQEKFHMHSRRNRSSNNDSAKEESEINKYTLLNGTETEISDDIEALNSQRSTHSSNTTAQRTTRSLKQSITKDGLSTTHSTCSTIVIHQGSKQQQTPVNKSIAVLRRIDQGDGDAANISDTFIQKQHSNLSSMTQSQHENLERDYEDDIDYEHEEADEIEEARDYEQNSTDSQRDDANAHEDYGITSNAKLIYNDDVYKDSKTIEIHNPDQNARMKKEISNIRKKITDDYKGREDFLENFCHQATSGILRDVTPKRRNNTTTERNIPSNRKNKLLAALKAIDNNKSQD